MRILLVNFALLANHGGILQCYALQEVLRSMGHKVVKAEMQPHFRFTLHQILAMIKRCIVKTFITRNSTPVLFEYNQDKPRTIVCHNTDKFIKKYLKILRVNSMSELNDRDYDAVIVGSDQVWRRQYVGGDKLLSNNTANDNAFLAFTDGWQCKRIAYAASVGVDYWEYDEIETEVIKKLAHNLDAISVREDSAIDLLHKHLGEDLQIKHVLDPTLLLDKEEYIKIFKNSDAKKSAGNLLVYILDATNEKNKIVSYFSETFGLVPFCVNNPNYENWELVPEERVQTSIELWLRGFYDANFVVADSFHACVFSIIFEKPFVVITNEKRGVARIHSLLRLFDLNDRVITSIDEVKKVSRDVDWNAVREKKEELAKYSRQWLVDALETKK